VTGLGGVRAKIELTKTTGSAGKEGCRKNLNFTQGKRSWSLEKTYRVWVCKKRGQLGWQAAHSRGVQGQTRLPLRGKREE